MLTTQIDNATFVVNGETYNAGDEIELTQIEAATLQRITELQQQITNERRTLFERCSAIDSKFNQEAANAFYDWEDLTLEHSTLSTRLMRGICRRLNGVIPLEILTTEGGKSVVRVRALGQNEGPVHINMDIIRDRTRFNAAIGDVRVLAKAALGEKVKLTDAKVRCDFDAWKAFGAPYMDITYDKPPFDLSYANDFTAFTWSEHETVQFDAFAVQGLGSVLSNANRLQGIVTRQNPLPMLACIIGPDTIRFINLQHASKPNDDYRSELLRKSITELNGKFLYLLQYGPLAQEGSVIDSQDPRDPRRPAGFSLMLAMRTNSGVIMGAKNWSVAHNPQRGPELQAYAVFENSPGLPSEKAYETIVNLFSDSTSNQIASDDSSDEPDVAPRKRKKAEKATK
jgi:hypothetical protein